MMKLKTYQENSLEVLRKYLEQARFFGAKAAYDAVQEQRLGTAKPYQALKGLADVPCACLRLPTGGGKTLLGAHTVGLAGQSYLERDFPLTLWLVPTNMIQQQTLESLKNPAHPNRAVLNAAFESRVRVFDIADFRNIRPQDISDAACIVVATFAALRVEKTEGRKVYADDENLEPHFSRIPAHAKGMERDEGTGKIKFSFANLLHRHRPLVIVDEAHNAKSELSIEVLNRLNPACVIEYTATPAKNSNVLHSVSAAELKAEDMIKLPILLYEHPSWEDAVAASIQTRQKLEQTACKDKDYIRPIVLFQAEHKGREITVEVLENYLLENECIEREQIAIATGAQRELDSINLLDPNCPIRYVITIEALKEGWDCSFAYVLCSIANTKSPTAVEQLLGRVLRMPFSQRRGYAELNRAYAHVSSQSWPRAAGQLHDRLVNMGFERQEAEEFTAEQPLPTLGPLPGFPHPSHPTLGLQGPHPSQGPQPMPVSLTLTQKPDLSLLDLAERACVEITETPAGAFVVSGDMDEKLLEKLSQGAANQADKAEILGKCNLYGKGLYPSQRGEVFSVPQLCLLFEDGPELAERETCLGVAGWVLTDYYKPLTKEHFTFDDQTRQYSADIARQKIVITWEETVQMELDGIHTPMNDHELIAWLDSKLHAPDIPQGQLVAYLARTVRDLLARADLDLPKLIRTKFLLQKVLCERIDAARNDAYKKGCGACLFGPDAIAAVEPSAYSFTFPADYPANLLYDGPLGFRKHFYPRSAMMNREEVACAEAIDQNPMVKFWVRNLERQPDHAFWLPTATDKFYPDFVTKLHDGRILVIEYKGAHLANEDSREKEIIGKVWAKKSGNLFLMAWKEDGKGRNIQQQIRAIVGYSDLPKHKASDEG